MSAPGRPKREYRSAQHEGSPVSAPGRPKREGSPGSALHSLSLHAAVQEITLGALSSRAYAEGLLARIAATDAAIGAWAHLDPDYVRSCADLCDAAVPQGPLAGIGIGVKDIIHTRALPTQMGSAIYAGFHPAEDAACVERVRRAGGFVFGKTVTTSFAFMDPGKTRNPWNPAHTPGGSSSGSAAAVAAGHVPGALGTQTNGSVIRPAAFCGVVGFKPTRGALPFTGIHVFSHTLDQLGTFTRSVSDAARLAAALADPGTIAGLPPLATSAPRLAYLRAYPWNAVAREAEAVLEAAVLRLRQHGAQVVPVDFPSAWLAANRIHRTIMMFEAVRHLGPLQARERARLTPKLNAALDEHRGIAAADYAAALAAREAFIREMEEWLEDFDAVLSPAAPGSAPAGLESTGDASFCTAWSLAGFPEITVPAGLCPAGLPIGMQLAAARGADDRLLGVASWCESRQPFGGLRLEDGRDAGNSG